MAPKAAFAFWKSAPQPVNVFPLTFKLVNEA